MVIHKRICTNLGNYYGYVNLIKRDDGYYLTLEEYDGCNGVKVSEEFALAFEKEFENIRKEEISLDDY